MMASEIERATRALRDPDAGVRRIAVLDLVEAADEEAVVPLLVEALRDADATVRAEAARGLEGI